MLSVNMWKLLLAVALAASLICNSLGQTTLTPIIDSTPTSSPSQLKTCETEALKQYSKALFSFTAKILYAQSHRSREDHLFGGTGIMYLLGQLALLASENTSIELQRVLNLNKKQILCVLPILKTDLKAYRTGIQYDSASKIISDNDCPFTEEFKNLLEDKFQISPETYDYKNPLSARIISDEIARSTNNNIKNFITSYMLSSLTRLILISAESFKGEWESKFNRTIMMNFYTDGRIVRKSMMYQRGTFLHGYSRSLRCRMLKLNYKGGEFSLLILLPNFIHDVTFLLKKLSSPDNKVLEDVENMRNTNLEIYIPRFKATSGSRKYPFMKTNVETIFNAKTAGLKRVASCPAPYVSEILQRTSLTIDENGGEQTYNTDLYSKGEEVFNTNQTDKPFVANRPFLYYIMYNGIPTLAGVYYFR